MIDHVFAAYMAAVGVDPQEAIQNGVGPDVQRRLQEIGLDSFRKETVGGIDVIKGFCAWLTPQLEYIYSRQVVGSAGREPGGGVLKVHRSGFPETIVTAMPGNDLSRFIQHPLLPTDAHIHTVSDLRPQFDIVNLWLGPI